MCVWVFLYTRMKRKHHDRIPCHMVAKRPREPTDIHQGYSSATAKQPTSLAHDLLEMYGQVKMRGYVVSHSQKTSSYKLFCIEKGS